MICNEYGSTGAKVSVVGFGGMRFDTSKSNEENAGLLLYAKDKGINYFDTAPGYCQDKSEDIFGSAFEQMADARDEFYVSTKGMPTELDTADKAIEAVEKSLKRLKVERIDFYHVWCIRDLEHYKLAMKKGGQYEGLSPFDSHSERRPGWDDHPSGRQKGSLEPCGRPFKGCGPGTAPVAIRD